MDLILSLTCRNQSTVHEWRVIWISVSFPSPCRCTCSSTHENIGEPAIIFFTGSLLASGRRTGSLHWCTCRRPPPPPHPSAHQRHQQAASQGLHSWLQIMNTGRSGHLRAGSTRLRWEETNSRKKTATVTDELQTVVGTGSVLSFCCVSAFI